MSRLAENVRREWETLRPDDVVYLLCVHPRDNPQRGINGNSGRVSMNESGLRLLRTAEVVQLLDDNGRMVREPSIGQVNGHSGRSRLSRLIVRLDAEAYKSDNLSKVGGKPDVYDSINLIVRRKGRENNFKKVLETMKSLTLADVAIPTWLQEVFLGYGDPAGASYARIGSQIKAIDFRDTFLNWEHLVESLPGKVSIVNGCGGSILTFGKIIIPDNKTEDTKPPFVLEASSILPAPPSRPSKKRRRGNVEPSQPAAESFKVSTYRPPNNGPYPTDVPRLNKIRFTPVQIEAIVSGSRPGLTVIVGPPGTGKTDVATQIINNIYHNFPLQRTLLITHSNQALNQLFQKIINLDIDQRHLLRLGHGEEDLETNANYGKYGRVESFLDNRARYLYEVDRLAANFGAPGAHGNSCETAGYFNSVYVVPAWSKFWDVANDAGSSAADVVSAFPFQQYFSNAPKPLFPPDASREALLDVAKGCERHIHKIFSELEDILPFEILRNPRDKTNYLMIKEARIVAMTSTHAAMRRQEISDLGFHYDNVIMEEAAQITEIENFIPLALQKPRNGLSPLQRIVLCGDHFQNSPIIQNLAFRQFANLEQSLFLRLVRLGVPTVNLDRQGRARPSIAGLYKWRYKKLDNLPNVLAEPEYLHANAGFRYEYQFIDVGDYKGAGESQPTPHFFNNLGEAEYAVAIYQYMRLLGYPASTISILTTYAGQKALIRDVLGHRCARNPLFGLPRIVTTVDKYQGEQNDCMYSIPFLISNCLGSFPTHTNAFSPPSDVILSLTRTTRVGYLRDPRRLTVALSRARLGLYVLGRRAVFENCYELREAFRLLFLGADKLKLVTGEMYPTARLLSDEAEATEMVGVEHLGRYVYEMTQAKVAALRSGEAVLVPVEKNLIRVEDDREEGDVLLKENEEIEEDEEEEEEEEEGEEQARIDVAEDAAEGGEDLEMSDMPE